MTAIPKYTICQKILLAAGMVVIWWLGIAIVGWLFFPR
jgi:hypothetical protein